MEQQKTAEPKLILRKKNVQISKTPNKTVR